MTGKTVFAAAIVAAAGAAQAQTLLTIDLSVVNQVTISTTGGASAATATGPDVIGVYFDNFYGAAGGALNESFVAGDLASAGSTPDGSPDLFRGGAGSDTGLNFWTWATESDVSFTAGSQAFTGSATWTLEADDYADMLAGSSSGDIYFPADTADDVAGATLIGQYNVIVPAPGAAGVLALGGLVAMRRRR